jgi:hypothetical protein
MTAKRRVIAAAIILLGCAGGLAVATPIWAATGQGGGCPEPRGLTDVENPGELSRLRVSQAEEPMAFEFGGRRGTRERDVPLELIDQPSSLPGSLVPRDGEPLAVRSPRLVEDTTDDQIPTNNVRVQATFDEDGQAVVLSVCVDVRRTDGFGPGSYHGVATLTDDRFMATDVPIDVALRSTSWQAPFVAALIGGVIGGAWGILSPFVATAKVGSGQRRDRKKKALHLLVISVILGLGTGALVFWQKYVEIGDFRGSGRDARTVLVTAFFAAAALYPIATVLERFWGDITDGDEEQSTVPGAATAGSPVASGVQA